MIHAIIIAFIALASTHGSEVRQITFPANIPSELKFILASPFTAEMQTPEFTATINALDYSIGVISDEELAIVTKIEILRGFLTFFNDEEIVLSDILNFDLPKIKKKYEMFPEQSLGRWICQAIAADFSAVIENSGIRGLILARKQGEKNISPHLLKLEKKAKLIAPWAQRLNDLEIDELQVLIDEVKLHAIKKIAPKLIMLMRERGLQTNFKESSSWKHFKWAPYVATAPQKTVEEIIDDTSKQPDTTKDEMQLDMNAFEDVTTPISSPVEPKDDVSITGSDKDQWTPPQIPTNKNLPKNWPTPNTNYVSPKHLPDPVNDWIMDL